ncbi:MAG: hypothetical protein BWX73_01261 [Lentisphaerae bacterium ADurb.Bin082]|nr:MAG: hypothetical protein BWX73_01261 [Lentisphaerae bacterium ADurb.Bin082]
MVTSPQLAVIVTLPFAVRDAAAAVMLISLCAWRLIVPASASYFSSMTTSSPARTSILPFCEVTIFLVVTESFSDRKITLPWAVRASWLMTSPLPAVPDARMSIMPLLAAVSSFSTTIFAARMIILSFVLVIALFVVRSLPALKSISPPTVMGPTSTRVRSLAVPVTFTIKSLPISVGRVRFVVRVFWSVTLFKVPAAAAIITLFSWLPALFAVMFLPLPAVRVAVRVGVGVVSAPSRLRSPASAVTIKLPSVEFTVPLVVTSPAVAWMVTSFLAVILATAAVVILPPASMVTAPLVAVMALLNPAVPPAFNAILSLLLRSPGATVSAPCASRSIAPVTVIRLPGTF